jgi:hypothetical protein
LRTEKISFPNKMRWLRFSGAILDLASWPYIGLFLFGKRFKNNPAPAQLHDG